MSLDPEGALNIPRNFISDYQTWKLRRLKVLLGDTTQSMALRLGLNPWTLRSWTSGKRKPSTAALAYLEAIAKSLDSDD